MKDCRGTTIRVGDSVVVGSTVALERALRVETVKRMVVRHELAPEFGTVWFESGNYADSLCVAVVVNDATVERVAGMLFTQTTYRPPYEPGTPWEAANALQRHSWLAEARDLLGLSDE